MTWADAAVRRQLEQKRAALAAQLIEAQAVLAACQVLVDVAGVPMVRNTPESSRVRVLVWCLEGRLRDVAAALKRAGAGAGAAGGTVAARPEAGV